jgi:ankyrin repeat protein
MAAVEILLSKGADPNMKGIDHATPLHCAASSGWTKVAKALLVAGADVYTGPTCSPICWAIDGSGGKHPTTVLLRERLGSDGWQKIADDHERVQAAMSQGGGRH